MLKTKCIVAEPEPSDGRRISVMSRHTLDDGETPDTRLTSRVYDEWQRELAPDDHDVGRYKRGQMEWDEFAGNYLAKLKRPEVSRYIRDLARSAKTENITLLCIEDSPEWCHRRLLAEACKDIEPDLALDIK